jgi:hypothetical protein
MTHSKKACVYHFCEIIFAVCSKSSIPGGFSIFWLLPQHLQAKPNPALCSTNISQEILFFTIKQ